MSVEAVAPVTLGQAPTSPTVSTEPPVREHQEARRASTPKHGHPNHASKVVDLTAGGDGVGGQGSGEASARRPETSAGRASGAGEKGKRADAAQLPPPSATGAGQPKEQEEGDPEMVRCEVMAAIIQRLRVFC